MAKQILSKDELDALLSAISTGELATGADSDQALEVTACSLIVDGENAPDDFDALEEVGGKFAEDLGEWLSVSTGSTLAVSPLATELIKAPKFMDMLEVPCLFVVFSMPPLGGQCLLVIESILGFFLVEYLMGGSGKHIAAEREFTAIERRILAKAAAGMLDTLSASWAPVDEFTSRVESTETKARYVRAFGPEEVLFVSTFSIAEGDFSASIHVCMPKIALEPFKDKLNSNQMVKTQQSPALSNQIERLLRRSEVTVSAELGRSVSTVRELLSLRADDVMRIDSGPEDNFVVKVEGIAKFEGRPGVVNGNLAVQIKKRLQRNGGNGGGAYEE